MTGFGSAAWRGRELDIEVELRSVNHRFFTLKQSQPEGFARREAEVEQMVRARVARGSATLTVTLRQRSRAGPALPDVRHFKAAYQRLKQVQKALGVKGEIEMEDLLAIPSLWSSSNGEASQGDLWPRVKKLIAEAVDALAAVRAREGEAIARDFKSRLDAIEKLLGRILERVPASVDAYQKKLDDRIRAILAQRGVEAAVPDIVKEVALYADRCDTSEEAQRLRAHIAEFRKIIQSRGQVGRRLDFLAQEMLRETNTIASKGSDAAISTGAVEIKSELEKIKEQVENVE